MKKNRKILGVALVLSLVALLLPATIFAADEGTVTCTVSGKLISVNITSDGAVAYGALAPSATQDTVTLTDTQTANNNGTVAEKFQIKSSDAIGGTPWTLGAAQGDNTFTHEFSITGGAPWTAMIVAGTYYDLVASVAVDGDQTFDLQIGMPTIIADYTAKTITVTVLATEA